MDTRLLVRRRREILGGEQLFAVGARLLGAWIAYRAITYAPFLLLGPLTREAIIGSMLPVVFGLAIAALLIYRPQRLARRLGIGSGPIANLPPTRDLLAIGLVLVGFTGLISSSFDFLSVTAFLTGDLIMTRFEIFTRLIPMGISVALILGGWTVAGWMVPRWREHGQAEDEEIEPG